MDDLFDTGVIAPGFDYRDDLVAAGTRAALILEINRLPLEAFDFHGFKANRRVISYGWRYEFASARLLQIERIPDWLLPLREIVGQFAKTPPEDFVQVLISEYAPGAGIGWHTDKTVFDRIVGVSLGAPCPLRLRRQVAEGKWQRAEQFLEPGSMYLLSGQVRNDWEHSIAPVQALRYSLTFRTLSRI